MAKFAAAEGKGGGEFYTPQCIVKLLVRMIEPYKGRIFDPCCGSGGMFVQSEKFVEEHDGKIGDIAIYGQESNATTWRLAKMNLAIRGIDANIGDRNADSFHQDFKGNDAKFIYYLLYTINFYSLNAGSAVPTLNRNHIHEIPIHLPPFHEQKAIAHILGSLDDKIELNRQMNETLEAMARAIFKSWFVDFDPVHAKAEGRDPGLPPGIANLFPDSFEESELGLIPKGWEFGTIKSEFHLTMGQSPPGETYNSDDQGLPFFQGKKDYGFRYPKNRIFCSVPSRVANEGDSLVSVRSPVGDINMASEKCCIGRGIAAIIHKGGGRSYTYYSMLNLRNEFCRFNADGTVFGAINKKQFEDIKVLAFSNELIKQFEKMIFPFDELISKNDKEIDNLTNIRGTLLPKLISGVIRVPDAEKFIKVIENTSNSHCSASKTEVLPGRTSRFPGRSRKSAVRSHKFSGRSINLQAGRINLQAGRINLWAGRINFQAGR